MNDITPKLTLQEKVSQRIKDQIGELLEPEDLKKLVDQAMRDAFFKDRPAVTNSYGSIIKAAEPPVVVETVKNLLKPQVDENIKAWLADNADLVQKIIDDVIKDGLLQAITNAIQYRLSGQFASFGQQIMTSLTQPR